MCGTMPENGKTGIGAQEHSPSSSTGRSICIRVIVVLASEFGWKKVLAISAAEISIALTIGGIAFRVLSLVM
jgi:hypothetical protein